jgi:hypothetical protein
MSIHFKQFAALLTLFFGIFSTAQAQYMGYFGNRTALTVSRISSVNLGKYENINNEIPFFNKAYYSIGVSYLRNPNYITEFQYAQNKLLLVAKEGLYHNNVLYYSSPNTSINRTFSVSLDYYNNSAAPFGLYIGGRLGLSSTNSEDPRGYKFEADTGNYTPHYEPYAPTWLGLAQIHLGYGIPLHERLVVNLALNYGIPFRLSYDESSVQNEMYSSEMGLRNWATHYINVAIKLQAYLF